MELFLWASFGVSPLSFFSNDFGSDGPRDGAVSEVFFFCDEWNLRKRKPRPKPKLLLLAPLFRLYGTNESRQTSQDEHVGRDDGGNNATI